MNFSYGGELDVIGLTLCFCMFVHVPVIFYRFNCLWCFLLCAWLLYWWYII